MEFFRRSGTLASATNLTDSDLQNSSTFGEVNQLDPRFCFLFSFDGSHGEARLEITGGCHKKDRRSWTRTKTGTSTSNGKENPGTTKGHFYVATKNIPSPGCE